ncbi:MAG: BlaI/MecI/CopY family transcriptional regulator [Prevotella sp.]|nr:BlaI/MecI/CopY family transcriptional regulator [Prevotella sp.]
MKKLTNKERGIMELFWLNGPMFVRELLEHYEEPHPHFNTLSTFVRRLEQVGYIGHKQYGSTYQYYALISEQDYEILSECRQRSKMPTCRHSIFKSKYKPRGIDIQA